MSKGERWTCPERVHMAIVTSVTAPRAGSCKHHSKLTKLARDDRPGHVSVFLEFQTPTPTCAGVQGPVLLAALVRARAVNCEGPIVIQGVIRARAVNCEGPIVIQGVIIIIIVIVYMDFAPFPCAQVHQSRQGRQAWGRVRFSGVSPMDDARWLCSAPYRLSQSPSFT